MCTMCRNCMFFKRNTLNPSAPFPEGDGLLLLEDLVFHILHSSLSHTHVLDWDDLLDSLLDEEDGSEIVTLVAKLTPEVQSLVQACYAYVNKRK